MAKSTWLELTNVVKSEVGESGVAYSSLVSLSAAGYRLAQWVKKADIEVQSRWFDWDFLHTGSWTAPTVIGDKAIAAPSDIGVWDQDSFVLDYSLATHSKLSVIPYKVWRDSYRNGVKVNQLPSFVAIKPDQSLILEAPPDAIYSLSADYWKRPAKMTLDGSTSLIPEEFERIIVARAKMFYAEFESAPEIMSSSAIEHDDLLDKLEAKYLSGQMNRRVSDTLPIQVIVE